MIEQQIGISDIRKLINTDNLKYKEGLGNYSYSLLSLSVEKFMIEQHLNSIEQLIKTMENWNTTNFEDFITSLVVDNSEFFRTPSVWRFIADEILLKADITSFFKIFLPDAGSGEELYSLAIILQEINLSAKVKILTSARTAQLLTKIKAGIIDEKSLELGSDNYKRANCKYDLNKYLTVNNNHWTFNTTYLNTTEFIELQPDEKPSDMFDLILFRNRKLYYDAKYENNVLSNLFDCLKPHGLLIIGEKETLRNAQIESKFKNIGNNENVFKKIN